MLFHLLVLDVFFSLSFSLSLSLSLFFSPSFSFFLYPFLSLSLFLRTRKVAATAPVLLAPSLCLSAGAQHATRHQSVCLIRSQAARCSSMIFMRKYDNCIISSIFFHSWTFSSSFTPSLFSFFLSSSPLTFTLSFSSLPYRNKDWPPHDSICTNLPGGPGVSDERMFFYKCAVYKRKETIGSVNFFATGDRYVFASHFLLPLILYSLSPLLFYGPI